MTRREHLLTIFAEECAETAQRASKALRFGDGEIQTGQPLSNIERLNQEFTDLMALHEMLVDEGIVPMLGRPGCDFVLEKELKKQRVEKFLRYSVECGTLTGELP